MCVIGCWGLIDLPKWVSGLSDFAFTKLGRVVLFVGSPDWPEFDLDREMGAIKRYSTAGTKGLQMGPPE